ncbi:MAG: hypothetical protein ABIJ96_15190 [Elusimicrobiota bacterium]
MTEKFTLITSRVFAGRARKLPKDIRRQLANRLARLAVDPGYSSLRTSEVESAAGDHGDRVFESQVSRRHRMTWEYGPGKRDITLRTIDCAD